MRLQNFAHVDPQINRTGLSGGGIDVQGIFDRYSGSQDRLEDDARRLRQDRNRAAVVSEPSEIEGNNCWLFQANPSIWDVESELRGFEIGDQFEWSVTRYGDEFQIGDPRSFS